MTLLTINEVAGQLAVSERTVRRMVRTGELVSARVGSAVRIDAEDLEEYVRVSKKFPRQGVIGGHTVSKKRGNSPLKRVKLSHRERVG